MSIIFINGRFLTMPITGVQRYARELLGALDQLLLKEGNTGAAEVICLAPPDLNENPAWSKIQLCKVGRFTGNLWEQIDLPYHARGHLLFSPANIGPFFHNSQVVTIHDASVFAFPQAYSFSFRIKYQIILKRMAKIARKIITDSKFSEQELIRYCKMDSALFKVIPLGSDHFKYVISDETILARTGLSQKKYFLGVGSQSPHKNLCTLMAAFQKLDSGLELVLVGGKFDNVFQNANFTLPDHTQQLGYLTDSEVFALYQHAVGFVFPSLYEGFGLPVLEAMSAGCPVICSNAASLPEVGEDAVLYCDPNSPEDISKQMTLLLENDALRTTLCLKGEQQVRKFSWEITARHTWETLVSAA